MVLTGFYLESIALLNSVNNNNNNIPMSMEKIDKNENFKITGLTRFFSNFKKDANNEKFY